MRPRGATWLLRTRGPRALVRYVAGHEGRLIWRGSGGLALLEPPTGHRSARAGGIRLAALRVLDRRWSVVLLPGPLVAVLVFGLRHPWLLVLVGTLSAIASFRLGQRRGKRESHWTMTLCHEPGGADPTELLRQTGRRLAQLTSADTLAYRFRGVTTQRMRDEVAQHPFLPADDRKVTLYWR